MTSKSIKIAVFGSAIALLAAGCNSSQQASNQSGTSNSTASMNSSSSMANMPGMQGHGMASSTAGHFGMPNLPVGSKPFFGTITSVSGSQVTISGHSRTSSTTVTTIVDITAATQFTGGSQSSLASGTRIAGYGTANSDGSINGVNVQINPSFGNGQGGGRYHGGAQSQSQSSQ